MTAFDSFLLNVKFLGKTRQSDSPEYTPLLSYKDFRSNTENGAKNEIFNNRRPKEKLLITVSSAVFEI